MSETWICDHCKLRQSEGDSGEFEGKDKCTFCGGKRIWGMIIEEFLNSPEAGLPTQTGNKLKAVRISEPDLIVEQDSQPETDLKSRTSQRKAFISWSIQNKFKEGSKDSLFEVSMHEVSSAIRELAFTDGSGTKLNQAEKSFLFQECIDDLLGFGAIESILRKADFTELIIYSADKTTFKKDGKESSIPVKFRNEEALKSFGDRVDKLASLNYEKSKEQMENEYFYRGWVITKYSFPSEPNLPFLSFKQGGPEFRHVTESDMNTKFPMVLTLNRSNQVDETKLRDKTRFISNLIKRDFPTFGINTRNIDYSKITRRLRQLVYSDSPGETMSSLEKSLLFQDCMDELFGFGPLGPILRDPMISDIFIYADGKLAVNKNEDEVQSVSMKFDDSSHTNRTIGKILEHLSPNPEIKDGTEKYNYRTFSVVLKQPPYNHDEPFCIIKMKTIAEKENVRE